MPTFTLRWPLFLPVPLSDRPCAKEPAGWFPPNTGWNPVWSTGSDHRSRCLVSQGRPAIGRNPSLTRWSRSRPCRAPESQRRAGVPAFRAARRRDGSTGRALELPDRQRQHIQVIPRKRTVSAEGPGVAPKDLQLSTRRPPASLRRTYLVSACTTRDTVLAGSWLPT